MATESQLKQEIADERRELTNAVASLREELGQTAERGKRLGAALGAATGAVLAAKTLVKLLRRHDDEKR
jgi:hypothetical protein